MERHMNKRKISFLSAILVIVGLLTLSLVQRQARAQYVPANTSPIAVVYSNTASGIGTGLSSQVLAAPTVTTQSIHILAVSLANVAAGPIGLYDSTANTLLFSTDVAAAQSVQINIVTQLGMPYGIIVPAGHALGIVGAAGINYATIIYATY